MTVHLIPFRMTPAFRPRDRGIHPLHARATPRINLPSFLFHIAISFHTGNNLYLSPPSSLARNVPPFWTAFGIWIGVQVLYGVAVIPLVAVAILYTASPTLMASLIYNSRRPPLELVILNTPRFTGWSSWSSILVSRVLEFFFFFPFFFILVVVHTYLLSFPFFPPTLS